ncbi:hypothetical protein D3C73_1516410 [compost metagenome]
MAALKPDATLRAMDAGRTISADTSRTPTTGIAAATVIPVSTANEKDNKPVWTPPIEAVSSSKVRLYSGRRRMMKYNSPAAATMAIRTS